MNNKVKSEARIEFDKANGKTKFVVIKIAALPDDCPVLVVTEFANKSFAEFHLADNVLVLESAIKTINTDIEIRKILKSKNKTNL